jgi:glycosyltransferase involved in cell wall biosynthesis
MKGSEGILRYSAAPRVLHVAETSQGGVASYIEDVVLLQSERYGFDKVRAIVPSEHGIQSIRGQSTVFKTFDASGASRWRRALSMGFAALVEVYRWRPNVVHLHSTYAGFLLRPLLGLIPNRPRVVYCAHGWAFDRDGPRWLNRTIQLIECAWSRWCDALVCISHADHESALRAGISANKLIVILNGIRDVAATTEPASAQWPANQLRILFVGRLDRQKGIDVLFDAMRLLDRDAFLVVVGSPVLRDEPLSLPPSNVRFMGWLQRDELVAYYAATDVLVVPSRWEGFGLVAIEAMRAGRAVVASRVGGLREVIQSGTTGFLFENGSAQDLAAALSALTPEKLQRMGEAGRLRYERHFRIERVVHELDAVYARLSGARVG